MIFNQIIAFITTYILSALILGAVLWHFFSKQKKVLDFSEIVIYSFGLGPMIISLLLYFLILFYPDKTNSFYIFCVSFIFIITGLVYRQSLQKYLKEIWAVIHNLREKFRKKNYRLFKLDVWLMGFLVLAVGIYIFIQAIGYPILSNDGTIYGMISRFLYEQKNFNNFPMVAADIKTGFYFGGGQHPPGLSLIYTWFYMIQGNIDSDVLLRVVSPLYTLYLTLLIWVVLRKRGNEYAPIFGVILMALTPIFIWQAYENSIDPIRLFFLFTSFILLAKFVQKESFNLAILLGATLGSVLYIHASGILIFLVVILIYLLISRLKIFLRISWASILIIIALILGGSQYGLNYFKFHNVLGPNISFHISEIKGKDLYPSSGLVIQGLDGQVQLKEGIKIPKDLIFGRLQIFTRPELFGLTYYLFTFAIIFWFIKMPKKKIDWVMLLGLTFIAIPIFYQYYVNRRYFLTIQPLAVYFGGLALGDVYGNFIKRKWAKWFWIIFFIAFINAVAVYFLPGSISSVKLKVGGKQAKNNYLFASKKEQNNILAYKIFDAIDFINAETPSCSVILTYDNGRYFYYSQRKGIYWDEPRMHTFYKFQDKEQARQYLLDLDIDYVMIDPLYRDYSFFKDSFLKQIVEDENYAKKVYNNETEVYQLIR